MKIDDRLPNYIQDFISSNEENTAIPFLSFNDWLLKRENQSKDWIIVARKSETNKKGNRTSYYTMSCIIEIDNDDARTNFLSNSSWYVNNQFGIPRKYQTPYEGERYDDGLIAEKQGVIYKPFVFHRFYNSRRPDNFQITEHFLLYYDCFWVEEKKEYQSVNGNGERIRNDERINLHS